MYLFLHLQVEAGGGIGMDTEVPGMRFFCLLGALNFRWFCRAISNPSCCRYSFKICPLLALVRTYSVAFSDQFIASFSGHCLASLRSFSLSNWRLSTLLPCLFFALGVDEFDEGRFRLGVPVAAVSPLVRLILSYFLQLTLFWRTVELWLVHPFVLQHPFLLCLRFFAAVFCVRH